MVTLCYVSNKVIAAGALGVGRSPDRTFTYNGIIEQARSETELGSQSDWLSSDKRDENAKNLGRAMRR